MSNLILSERKLCSLIKNIHLYTTSLITTFRSTTDRIYDGVPIILLNWNRTLHRGAGKSLARPD